MTKDNWHDVDFPSDYLYTSGEFMIIKKFKENRIKVYFDNLDDYFVDCNSSLSYKTLKELFEFILDIKLKMEK
jgi:hypothetical protein